MSTENCSLRQWLQNKKKSKAKPLSLFYLPMELSLLHNKPCTKKEIELVLKRNKVFTGASYLNLVFRNDRHNKSKKLVKGAYEKILRRFRSTYADDDIFYGVSYFLSNRLVGAGVAIDRAPCATGSTAFGVSQIFFTIEPNFRHSGYSALIFPHFVARARDLYYKRCNFPFEHQLVQFFEVGQRPKQPDEGFFHTFFQWVNRDILITKKSGWYDLKGARKEENFWNSLTQNPTPQAAKKIWDYLLDFAHSAHQKRHGVYFN